MSDYWRNRTFSGSGSLGELGAFKAFVINAFVAFHGVRTVIDFGCGNGDQLAQLHMPLLYTGYDVSPGALSVCRERFEGDFTKSFADLADYDGDTADLTMSLDVIFHLMTAEALDEHLSLVFGASDQYVIIYSSNTEIIHTRQVRHVRHWRFTDWVDIHASDWELIQHIPNRYPWSNETKTGSHSEFFIYAKETA